jgi:tetratricopeptide (TPR) repeat protein
MANELYYTQDISQTLPYQQYMRDIAGIAEKITDRENAANAKNVAAVQSAITSQTYQVLASQNVLRQTMAEGLDAVNNNIDRSFSKISNELGTMTSAMSMGFALTVDAIGRMSNEVCARLDKLTDIAENRRRYDARELYRSAFSRYKDGYFEDALEDIVEAVKLEKTDYLSWFLMGRIYAFGVGEFGNVINLDKAIAAYKNAVFYAEGPAKRSEDAKGFAAEANLYLGLAQLPKSHELRRAGNAEEAAKWLAAAYNSFARSYKYSSRMLESLYNAARCKILLGESGVVLPWMKTLIEQDWPYYIKACADSDFAPIHGKLPVLVTKMRDEVYTQALPVLRDIAETYEQANREGLTAYIDYSDKEQIENCISEGIDPKLPYVDTRNRYKYLLELRGGNND